MIINARRSSARLLRLISPHLSRCSCAWSRPMTMETPYSFLETSKFRATPKPWSPPRHRQSRSAANRHSRRSLGSRSTMVACMIPEGVCRPSRIFAAAHVHMRLFLRGTCKQKGRQLTLKQLNCGGNDHGSDGSISGRGECCAASLRGARRSWPGLRGLFPHRHPRPHRTRTPQRLPSRRRR